MQSWVYFMGYVIYVSISIKKMWLGKASMTDMKPSEDNDIFTTETTQITIAKERFDTV